MLVPFLVSLLPILLPDRPPLAHTGGFGEPTCQQCHFGNPLNDPPGRVVINGLPRVYVAGRTYTITVALARPGLARAGFELAARHFTGPDSGRQAGRMQPGDAGTDVTDTTHAGFGAVQYARHVRAASTQRDSARWTLKWTAPAKPAGAVVFHVAANAANDDASELSDYIYSSVWTIPPR